jgi:hypothetical protein
MVYHIAVHRHSVVDSYIFPEHCPCELELTELNVDHTAMFGQVTFKGGILDVQTGIPAVDGSPFIRSLIAVEMCALDGC